MTEDRNMKARKKDWKGRKEERAGRERRGRGWCNDVLGEQFHVVQP